ncbi:ABC transporter permease [Xanthomonas sp. GPE 39]|uniref:ABC transporter permease n=1 Tax=Xanthomonas sp. GPE 39 TaxID=1583099 RepID=UPI0005F2878A|nr:ABC transporter permease [Xanthomonas sp. GPE 39]
MDSILMLGKTRRVYWLELKYELLRLVRSPMYVFSMLGLPLAFFLIFGLANRSADFLGYPMPRYLLASYTCFGAMGSALFAIGAGLALERGRGWLELKRASPMPPAAYVLAKLAASVVFGLSIGLMLMVIAGLVINLQVSAVQVLQFLAVITLGVLCFAAIGVFAGMLMPPDSAAGLMNLVYLPLSLCGGLWLPIEQLPAWLQGLAKLLPSYHFNRLALAALGYANEASWLALLVLAGYTAVFGVGAALMFRAQEANR